jgi:hypothetical protein
MVNKSKCSTECLCCFTLVRKSLIHYFHPLYILVQWSIHYQLVHVLLNQVLFFIIYYLQWHFISSWHVRSALFFSSSLLSKSDDVDQLIPFIVTLCLASSISLYPIVLIAPALLQFSKNRDVNLFLISRRILKLILWFFIE